MKTIKIWNDDPSDRQLDELAEAYDAGDLIIVPTDTLYAITCKALDPKAIERLCKLKNINVSKTNLSIMCSDISMASEYARFDNSMFRLLKDNTPGPFTFLFQAASTLPKVFKGRKTVGIRIPDNNFCLKIIERLGSPLLTTSVDFQTDDYGINPELIAESYENRVDFTVLGEDGGLTPSTIIDCTGGEPVIIREGKGKLI